MRRVGLIKTVLKCSNVYETKFDPGSRKGSCAFLAHGGKGAPAKHRCMDPRRTTVAQQVCQPALESIRVKSSRAPRDPAAWTRPCLLCTSCTCSFPDCAGRCSPLRIPCTGSFPERAGRCSPLRTPCTGSFADCARIAITGALTLRIEQRASCARAISPGVLQVPAAHYGATASACQRR